MEKPLLDYGGTVNEDVDFGIKKGYSGIDLKGFCLDGVKMEVEEVIEYEPWCWDQKRPGSGQIGLYKVKSGDVKRYAVIKDYRAAEGDWRIFLLGLTETEAEGRKKLKDV